MKYTREQIEACAAVMEYVLQFKTAGVIRQLLAENDALREDAANARKAAIEDCAELLARQHAWLTNVAAATLVLNMDTAKQGA